MEKSDLRMIEIKAVVPVFQIDTIAKVFSNISRDGVEKFDVSDIDFSPSMAIVSLKKEHLKAISYEEKTYVEFEKMVKDFQRKRIEG